jgi:hypothetical protein
MNCEQEEIKQANQIDDHTGEWGMNEEAADNKASKLNPRCVCIYRVLQDGSDDS